MNEMSAQEKILRLRAKNGQFTCEYNGRFLLSAYNPKSEAEKFVETLKIDFRPSVIFIIEPLLSWCEKPLRKKFPNSKLCAIRFFNDFSDSDIFWDKVLYFSANSQENHDKNSKDFSEILYDNFGEEILLSSFFFALPSIISTFSKRYESAMEQIKSAILKSRAVLFTRARFAKKWLINSIRFHRFAKHFKAIQKGENPIIIAASGSSLTSSLAFIKKYKKMFFLIAVSSALFPLLNYGIEPDLVLTSDGGFYAGKHLDCLEKSNTQIKKIPIAMSDEAHCARNLLSVANIIPLKYSDSSFDFLYKVSGIKFLQAKRNGTVSGTATEFALELTTSDVFLCGLDLCSNLGFQHANPNALEIIDEAKDFRIATKETRSTTSRFNSEESLSVYRNWFRNREQNFYSRVFRLSDNFKYSFDSAPLKDMNWNDFSEKIKKINFASIRKIKIVEANFSKNEFSDKEILKAIENNLNSTRFLREIFPAESLSLKKALSEEKIKTQSDLLNDKKHEFISKIRNLLNV